MESTNAKYPTMLWASLMSDNEKYISNFLTTLGWGYSTFAKILTKHYATSVFHVAVGKSKRKSEHYDAAVNLILATAKDFWLYPCTELRKELRDGLAAISVNGEHPYAFLFKKFLLTEMSPSLKFDKKYVEVEVVDIEDVECTDPSGELHFKPRADGATMEKLYLEVHELKGPLDSSELEFLEVRELKSPQPTPVNSSELVAMKKQLGGFYLLHTLYWKQPYKGLNHIVMDTKDLAAVNEFENKIKTLLPEKLRDEYNYMMTRLKLNRAFDFHVFADSYGIDYSTRNLLNAKYDNHVEIIKFCKELQDELTHNSRIELMLKKTSSYLSKKTELLRTTAGANLDFLKKKTEGENQPRLRLVNIDEESGDIQSKEPPAPEPELLDIISESGTPLDRVYAVARGLKNLGEDPMITRNALLGNEAADRQLTNEAQKRRQRMEAKEQKGNPAQRYDRDIFGSRKVKQPERTQKRGRSQTSVNLWSHYIPENFEFPKCGAPAPTTTSDGDAAAAVQEEILSPPKSTAAASAAARQSPKKMNPYVHLEELDSV